MVITNNYLNLIFLRFRSTFHSRYKTVTSIFAEILIWIIHVHSNALNITIKKKNK